MCIENSGNYYKVINTFHIIGIVIASQTKKYLKGAFRKAYLLRVFHNAVHCVVCMTLAAYFWPLAAFFGSFRACHPGPEQNESIPQMWLG